MPYTINQNDAGEYCVYKQDAEGEPMGESLGCHETQAEAREQIGAVEASEASKLLVRPTQDEAGYLLVSTTQGQACANCRWFRPEHEVDGVEYEGGYCHLIDNWPESILPTGYCDRWEETPGMPEPEPLPVVIVEDQRAIDETKGESDIEYYIPAESSKGLLQRVKDRFSSDYKPGQTMFRDADGRRYMAIITSSYQDREDEALMAKALKRYADSCWLADDYFKSNNLHQVWHHDSLAVGDIVWADMKGPFLLEISKERDDIVSKKAWDYWESDEGSQDLGASPRYWYRKQDKTDDGAIPLISKFETSTLPRQAAANLLTFSGVIPMSKARDEYLDKMFGVQGVAEMLKEGPEKLAKALAEAGIQGKSVDNPTPEEAAETAKDNFSALLLQMIESQADILARFDDQQTATEEKSLAQNTRLDDLQAQLKAFAADNNNLRAEMRNSPRASETAATQVTDPHLQTEIENKSVTYDPAFPGMKVPLEK